MRAGWRERWSRKLTLKTARKIAIAVVGSTVVLIGVALLVLPGPGLLVLILGLALLATEFVWARRWLERVRNMVKSGKKAVSDRFRGSDANQGK